MQIGSRIGTFAGPWAEALNVPGLPQVDGLIEWNPRSTHHPRVRVCRGETTDSRRKTTASRIGRCSQRVWRGLDARRRGSCRAGEVSGFCVEPDVRISDLECVLGTVGVRARGCARQGNGEAEAECMVQIGMLHLIFSGVALSSIKTVVRPSVQLLSVNKMVG
jgi:hypothetical protein